MVAFKRGENRIRRRSNAFRAGYVSGYRDRTSVDRLLTMFWVFVSSAVFFTLGVLVGCIGLPS